ncbi:MAG TPA: hypothetical protein P5254_13800 [Aquihabitans sp.]|nr:hypothetical protein [Aquihabitans sp.]
MSARLLAAAVAVVGLVGLVGGCGVDGGATSPGTDAPTTATPTPSAGAASTTTAPLGDEPVGHDPTDCNDADAVGAVVGGEVDGFAADGRTSLGDLEYTYAGCTYTSYEDDLGFLGISRLDATAGLATGGRLFEELDRAARAAAWRDRFEPVPGLGDDAYLDGTTVVVLDGDVMAFVGYEPADLADLGDPSGPAPALELARATLALELSPDRAPSCDEVEPLVADAIGEPAESRVSSGFIGVNEVAITTTGCSVDLEDGASASVAVADATPWADWVAAKGSFSLRATYAAVDVGGRPGFDDGRQLVVDDGVAGDAHRPWSIDTGFADGDAGELAALRRDLAVAVVDG